MRLKPETVRKIFLCLVVVVSEFSETVTSFESKCPPLRLISGRSRYRWRGRSVRFNCMRGFQLVGVKYATCMNGKWDADVPICVKYGCRAPSTTHVNGQFIESYRGAVVKIVCNPGYSLIGSPSVYCNGVRWNETFPVCRVLNSNPSTSCDFEDPDLCGWSQDPMHDFDWKRQKGLTSSGEATTGPPFDHTRGENDTAGFYMYLENSSRRSENETARLYSPVYPRAFSNGSCFKFWYQMSGIAAGYLKVYVKPEGVELYNLIPSFWINGDQGRSWNQGFFSIDPTGAPFQFVVEGVIGPEQGSDTAFDDVKLAFGEECIAMEEALTSSTDISTSVNPEDDAIDLFSCKNRCNEESGANASLIDDGRCHCYETCDRDGTCCRDYFDLCSFFASTTKSSSETTDTNVSSSTSMSSSTVSSSTVQITPSKPSSVPSPEPPPKLTPPSPSPKHYNNESNEIDPKIPFPSVAPTIPQPKIPPTWKKKPIPPGKNRGVKKTAEDTLKRVKSKGRGEEEAGTTTKAPSTTTTPARVTKNTKPSNIKLTFLEKPSSPFQPNESRFHKGKSKELSGKEPPQAIKVDQMEAAAAGQGSLRGAFEVGGTALAVLIIIILGVLWYRRNQNKKTERETMVEDSDVRFLTSDEVLDFTLARPADDDL